MCVVGPSECGKTRLIFDMLTTNTFYSPFNKIYYCYRHWQDIYNLFRKSISNIEFIQITGDNFEIINTIVGDVNPFTAPTTAQQSNTETEYGKYKTLMIFDDVAEEI